MVELSGKKKKGAERTEKNQSMPMHACERVRTMRVEVFWSLGRVMSQKTFSEDPKSLIDRRTDRHRKGNLKKCSCMKKKNKKKEGVKQGQGSETVCKQTQRKKNGN